ncbi:TonB-dependent siderophore receptor [Acinetobacter sp. MD2]|uniref:TonB-dependent siderophore receptor n=1 Tax=Acinetobacter sp. MD2 TaxID=2600066 RepID=UPI002D1EA41C|nr:TonB-dependent siderophore receptor [Acinetobacter sp. MD2]MEB3766313.1 TonB-dependent siderophore receptor [Acinetobacter sp. MD2]
MRYHLSALSFAVLSIMGSTTSYANDTDGQPTLATITVKADTAPSSDSTKTYTIKNSQSATKLNIDVKETPQTLNVVTRQQMDDFSLHTTRDILNNTPGVTVTGLETNRTTYTARGFNISNILVDGVGFPQLDGYDYWNYDPDSYFYDRVEVVKGADALTNALGSPGATINYVRKRPTKEFQANAGISYGSWNTQRYEADISGSLTQDGRVRGRLVGFEKTGNSYLDRNSEEKNGIQGILEADITDATTASIGYSKMHQYTNGAQWGSNPLLKNGVAFSYATHYNYVPSWTYYDYDIDNYFANVEQKLGDNWKLKLSYDDKRFLNTNKMLYINTVNNIDYLYPSIYNQKITNKNANINVDGKFDLFGKTHDIVMGYNWAQYKEKFSNSVSTEMLEYLKDYDVTHLIPTSIQPSTNYAEPTWYQINDWTANGASTLKTTYATTRLNINDKLKAILGASYNQLDYTAYQGAEKYTKNKLTPYVGLTYNFSPNYTAYLSYTSIFLPNGSKLNTSKKTIGPKEGKSYELGLKASWFNDRLTGSFAVFKTTQNNYTVDSGKLLGSVSLFNVYNVESQGIEANLAGQVSDNLDLSVGYSKYALKSRLDGTDPNPNLPKQSFNLLTTYTIPQIPKLKIGAGLKWQDQITDTSYSTVKQHAYTLLSAMASYEVNDHLALQINGNNLTNKKYLTGLSGGQGYYGAPANYNIAVQFKY